LHNRNYFGCDWGQFEIFQLKCIMRGGGDRLARPTQSRIEREPSLDRAFGFDHPGFPRLETYFAP
jgi:hypothetical protein